MMTLATIIGTAAATLTTASFIPQVVKIVHTRNTEGISLLMYIIFGAGVALWLTYGLMIASFPVIACNATTLVLVLVILWHKVRG